MTIHAIVFNSLNLLTFIVHVSSLREKISSIANFRPVIHQSPFYRCATLDDISVADAKRIIDGTAFTEPSSLLPPRRLAAIIDLRNIDEIQKGITKRTDGARVLYSSLATTTTTSRPQDESPPPPMLYNIPLLEDINGFWDEAIMRMDATDRLMATLRTTFVGGALDKAAARNLERGGLKELYTIMLDVSSRQIGHCLDVCLNDSEQGVVLFHCQKGKDRTGLIAMLLQSCLGSSDRDIIRSYGESGILLNENQDGRQSKNGDDGSGNGGLVDWSHFRGSPESAMDSTLEYIRDKYGSVEGYLDYASFGLQKRNLLKARVEKTPTYLI